MKSLIFTFILLMGLGLTAQAVTQAPPEDTPGTASDQQLAPIPDANNTNPDNPAVATTVTVDSVTLPEPVRPLPPNELAHSIAQPGEAGNIFPAVFGQK